MRAVNLIPSDMRGGSAMGSGRSEGGAYAVLGVLGGLALLMLLYGIARHDISSRSGEAASLSAKTERAQATAAALAPYSSFVSLREQRVAAVSQLVDSRFDWAHALHEFGRVLPADATITSLDGAVGTTTGTGAAATAPTTSASSSATPSSTPATPGAATTASAGTVTSATPAGSVPTFTVSGCATSQAAVAETLERLRLIDGVSEVTLQSSTKDGTAGSAGAGGCGATDPVFTVLVSFQPLPSESAVSTSLSKLTSATGGTR
jgi:Tfp pilus assembly protein PilN